jgi:hypothetical protein
MQRQSRQSRRFDRGARAHARQLRGEAHPKAQVKSCDLAVAGSPTAERKDRKLPAPASSEETQAYWDGAVQQSNALRTMPYAMGT